MRTLYSIFLVAFLLPHPSQGCAWLLAGLAGKKKLNVAVRLPRELQMFGSRLDHDALNATVVFDRQGAINKRRTSANQRKILTFMQQNPPESEADKYHHISLYDQMLKTAVFADADSDIIAAEAIKMIMQLSPEDIPPGTGDAFLLYLKKDRHHFKGQNIATKEWRKLFTYIQNSSYTGEEKREFRDAVITGAIVDLTLNPNLRGGEEFYPANVNDTLPVLSSFRECDPAHPFYDWRETPAKAVLPTYSPLAVVRLVTEFGDLLTHEEFRTLVQNMSVRDKDKNLWALQEKDAHQALSHAIEHSPEGADRVALHNILKERKTWTE